MTPPGYLSHKPADCVPCQNEECKFGMRDAKDISRIVLWVGSPQEFDMGR